MSAESAEPLRILLLNQNWFVAELKALGHEVVCAGWAHDGFDVRFQRLIEIEELLSRLPNGFVPNRVVYFDDSHSVSVRGIERLAIPSLFYSIDIHHHWRWHSWFASLFDEVAVAQKDYTQRFREINSSLCAESIHWLPLWAPVYVNPQPTKSIDVCFRGTLDPKLHPVRAAFFEELKKLVPVDAAEGEYTAVYPSAKIVVNQSVGEEVNFRVFETMMCGAMLVTPEIGNGFSELFQEGRHLRTYTSGDAADAARVIREALKDDVRRNEMAVLGREEVLLRHSAPVRASWVSSTLRNAAVRAKPRKAFGAAMSYLHGLGTFRPAISGGGDAEAAYRAVLVESAASALLESLHRDEPVDEEFRAAMLICKCYLEAAASREVMLEFSARLRGAKPSELVFNMSYIEDLLALDRRAEAEATAKQISSSSDELLASVPTLMKSARAKVLDAVQK